MPELSFFLYCKFTGILDMNVDKDELLPFNKTELNINQINQVVETELVSIDKIKIPNEFLKILSLKL